MRITRFLIFILFLAFFLSACKLDLSSKITIGGTNRVALSQEEGVTARGTISWKLVLWPNVRMRVGL